MESVSILLVSAHRENPSVRVVVIRQWACIGKCMVVVARPAMVSSGKGRRLMPRFWIKAPALTGDALFDDADHKQDSSGHGDHGNYDAVSLRRAITEGVDPAGEPLDQAMPRWSMNESDLNDLIAYLQKSHDR